MPITGIKWRRATGHDLHLLRGMPGDRLVNLLQVTDPDGDLIDVLDYLADNADVTIEFRPSFGHVLDVTTDPPVCTGLGLILDSETGAIRFGPGDPEDPDPPDLHNFLIHATAQDSSDDSEYRTSIRVHVHNRVTSAWLTPPLLTLRPSGPTLPQTTQVQFSVRAQFDDGTVGDLTQRTDFEWRPSANVDERGRLIIADGNGPDTPPIQIEAALPIALQDESTPDRITATGRIQFAADWTTESTVLAETVQVQDTWPGTINPELVPNFLFLCDGYKAEDQPRFESQVRSLLALMKRSKLTRPFDLLATSMNYYQAFIPSRQHGIAVLCEVYPDQTPNGEPRVRADGTLDVFCVPDGEDPSPGDRWDVGNVIFRLGLPVPAQGPARPVQEIRDYWDRIVDDVPQERISDRTVRAWQKLALRSFVEEPDSVLGLAYGEYPSASDESDSRMIGFHPRRMRRARLDPILSRLVDAHGNSLGQLWMQRRTGRARTATR